MGGPTDGGGDARGSKGWWVPCVLYVFEPRHCPSFEQAEWGASRGAGWGGGGEAVRWLVNGVVASVVVREWGQPGRKGGFCGGLLRLQGYRQQGVAWCALF